MAKKLKLSPWHDGSVKPVRVGWYQMKGYNFVKSNKKGEIWRKWTGKRWVWLDFSGRLTGATVSYDDKWRGVLK